ncbi:MAG TPA: bifunctional protein-serine/threonine kinase/phosphatase [Chthoniobacterales bacterium]
MKVNATAFGCARSEKEASQDAFTVKVWDQTVIAVLADGAGGVQGGQEAASHIVESLATNYAARPKTWTPQKALGEFTRWVNHRLYHDSLERYGSPELVSTVAAAVIEGDKLYGLNVGDSRVYLAHAGQLRQLSEDHASMEHGRKHILNRAVGLAPEVEPHFFAADLADGDVALLCSDGLSNVFDAPTLTAKLNARCPARTLVSAARARATPELLDDVSAVVLDITRTGNLQAVSKLSLEVPDALHKGMEVDGFTLIKAFQHNDRVWLAVRDGHRFTLKFAPIEARDNEAVLNQFVKETWNATRLPANEFLVKAFVPVDGTVRCYAMEFIEAPSLRMLLRSRRLAVDEAVALGRFLLKAGQHLIGLDLVHGDVKPDNILVLSSCDSVTFKLVDFGSTTEVFSVTSRAGTASYLAPERFRGAAISERTEIFAIGVTLFEALTQRLPFGEIERFQTPHFHTARKPSHLNPNVPPWLEAVLLRACSPEPERRYQNYSEMLFNLTHPDSVEPFYPRGASLLEKNPLGFYKCACLLLLTACIALIAKLLMAGVRLL